MKYALEITAEQADVIVKALDLYSRIGIGQLEEIIHIYRFDNRKVASDVTETKQIDFDELHKAIDLAKLFLGQPANGSYGIHAPSVPDRFRVAWDIQKVIRNRLALDRAKNTPFPPLGVDFYPPTQSSKHPLPSIEQVAYPLLGSITTARARSTA